ncbi:uncharacterized protein LOC143040826 [Oratosquilla oratoria]|uniref:uncharacterized protein LOC143040826 n=1 Tax=Oratosquilla oratoria TaxID=337810 RepID=UPI003F775208
MGNKIFKPQDGNEDDLVVSAIKALVQESVLSYKQIKDGLLTFSESLDFSYDSTLTRNSSEGQGRNFGVRIKSTLDEEIYIDDLYPTTTVAYLKASISDKKGIPTNRQILVFNRRQLQDSSTLEDHGLSESAVLSLIIRISGGWCPNPNLLDPEFHHDFTHMKDDGTSFVRGNEEYIRPYGWKRFALKVRGKYESDTWLGEPGSRRYSSEGEWPVSYHGTSSKATESIAENGYDMSKGKRFYYGPGIYSTPYPEMAAGYAPSFKHKRRTYLAMVQSRYDPAHTNVVANKNYLVTEKEEYIRPYGILVRKAKARLPDHQ